MKKLTALPLPREPAFEVELPVGTEVLRVGVLQGKPYLALFEPIGGIVVKEKRRFVTCPLGVTVKTDDIEFIGSFCGGEIDFYVFEIKGVVLHAAGSPQIQAH